MIAEEVRRRDPWQHVTSGLVTRALRQWGPNERVLRTRGGYPEMRLAGQEQSFANEPTQLKRKNGVAYTSVMHERPAVRTITVANLVVCLSFLTGCAVSVMHTARNAPLPSDDSNPDTFVPRASLTLSSQSGKPFVGVALSGGGSRLGSPDIGDQEDAP
jgi:hypothetical protein